MLKREVVDKGGFYGQEGGKGGGGGGLSGTSER